MGSDEENLEFSDSPLGPPENRHVRYWIFREHSRRQLLKAWALIPPTIVAIFTSIGLIWGWASGFFHSGGVK